MDLEDNPNQVPGGPEYTELGIKVMGYKFTMKLQRRASSASAERARMAAAAAASETATEVTDGNVETTSSAAVRRPQRRRRPRSNSRASTSSSATAISDTLRMLDLDSNARSRRPVSTSSLASNSGSTRLANWEFQGFYNAPSTNANRTATPVSSGYSSEAVSRTSSFSSARLRDHAVIRQTRLASADDSIYSDVYSTINEELAELSDPFDGDNEDEDAAFNKATKAAKKTNMKKGKSTTSLLKGGSGGKAPIPEPRHCKTKSMTSLAHEMIPVERLNHNTSSAAGSTQTILATHHAKSSSLLTVTPENPAGKFKSSQQSLAAGMPPDMAPPLPMRSSKCRPPARPPYPSSLVRAVQEITQPLHM